MTIAQIFAILSILTAFGVPQQTVDNVRAILIPPIASTTPVVIVPIIHTPVVENEPVYFGSTKPTVVNPPPIVIEKPTPLPEPVVIVPKDTTPPKMDFEIFYFQQDRHVNGVDAPEGYYLRIWANELLDLPKTKVQDGVTLGTIVYTGKPDGWSSVIGNLLYHEIGLIGDIQPRKSFSFTITDMEGNETAMKTTINIH